MASCQRDSVVGSIGISAAECVIQIAQGAIDYCTWGHVGCSFLLQDLFAD